MAAPLGICEKCGEPVRDRHTAAYPVTGWEVLRDQGGANAIKNRERVPGRIRHVRCIPDPRINEAQEALL